MRAKLVTGIAVVVVLGLCVAWAGLGRTHVQTGPITIGASLPLSGEAASYGEQARSGIELALKEVNDAGGVLGRPVRVVYEDDSCTASGGVDAFTKLVETDGVSGIIGPVCTAAASAGLPVAQSHDIPTVIISASAPSLTAIGNDIFRVYPSDALQGSFAAQYAYTTLGKHSVAILYVQNDWGEGLRAAFTKEFTELGGTITDTEGVAQSETDMRTQLVKIGASKPEMIYMPLQPNGGVAAASEAKMLGIRTLIMGGDFFDAKEFTSVAATNGILFTSGDLSTPDAFKAKIQAVLGKDTGATTPFAYDAFKVLAAAIEKAGDTDPAHVRTALAATSYEGVSSSQPITFDAGRDLQNSKFQVRIVENGSSQPYTP